MIDLLTEKALPSSVNCAAALVAGLPLAQFDPNGWRFMTVAAFFLIQQVDRCPGMRLTGRYWIDGKEGSLLYTVLYTASFATLLWYVWIPLDIALANGFGQLICLYCTGNTIHGHLAGAETIGGPQWSHMTS